MKRYLTILMLSCLVLVAACNTASTQKGPEDETAPPNTAETAKTEKVESGENFPNAPAGLMTADVKLLDGNTFRLENEKGKVTLLNLWATWCGPCRAEMPDLIELEGKYSSQGFQIVGLNSDGETPEQVNPFVDEMKLNYKIGWADENMMKEFLRISKQPAIPQSFLIDRQGRLRGVFTGGGKKVVGKLKETVEKVVAES